MSTLIVKNFRSELDKVVLDKSLIANFWILDPENDVNSLGSAAGFTKNMFQDSSIAFDRENKKYVKYTGKMVFGKTETLPKFVFYPYFDEQGNSHLIYSESKDNKSITIYFKKSQKKGDPKKLEDREIQDKKDAFEEGFKRSWLNKFKGKKIPVEQEYFNDLKDNGPDPNYASLLNFIFGKVGQKLKLEPLINIIQKQFRDRPKGFIFKSGGQTLLLNEKDPARDDFSNVLGMKFLTNTIIMSAYQLIPNHSKISLIGTEGNEMFRSEYIASPGEVNNVPTLKSLIDARPKNTQYFLLSNFHKNHWLLFLIKTKPSLKLEIYDSIPQDSVSEYMDTDVLVEQMNDVFKPIKKFTENDILIKPTERQKDGYNCGVFTLLQMQKLLNDTKTIFDVSQKEGEEATLKATPASYRMDMLAKIWSSGKFEASQIDQDRLPKLLSNLYIRMLDIPKRDKERAHFFQEILKAEDPKVEFDLGELYKEFENEFPIVDSISKTDSKMKVETLTDLLTSGLTKPMKERLRLALLHMRDNAINLTNTIISKRENKVSSADLSKFLKVDKKQVDDLFAFDKKNTAKQTATWLDQFDANQRINMYNSLPRRVSISIDDDDDADFAFASTAKDFKELSKAKEEKRVAEEAERVAREADEEEKSESKKNEEEEEEEDEYDDLVDIKEKLEELSDIASKKKYKCERECILRISDKLFREFASKVEQLNPEKIKTFSIYEILNGKNDSSSSSTIQSRLESKMKEAKLQDVLEKAALVPTLARVISILE